MLMKTDQLMMAEGLDKSFNDAVIKGVNGHSLYDILLISPGFSKTKLSMNIIISGCLNDSGRTQE